MTINSMTGFGRASGMSGTASWTVEMKSVNGRSLDVRVKLPPGLDRLDAPLRQAVGAACQRGNIQVSLTLDTGPARGPIHIDEAVLEALHAQASAFASRRGLPPVELSSLLALRGVIVEADAAADPAVAGELDPPLLASIGDAASMLAQSRRQEGQALLGVLSAQIAAMEALLAAASAARDAQADIIRRRLHEQVAELLGASDRFDPQRLHQEAALLATRADIREELDRFAAHCVAARALLAAGGPIGRRLDFLAQEMGRETNTICSKSSHTALTEVGLDLKSLVEQFREQVQNVE